MRGKRVGTFLVACTIAVLTASGAAGDAQRDAILVELLARAKKDDATFGGFSAERGGAFYRATHQGGKPETPSCTTCHGTSPQEKGKTRAGKDIEPMAISKNPARYTDNATVEKWFGRNCSDVLGRSCTAQEKGDFLTFMISQ